MRLPSDGPLRWFLKTRRAGLSLSSSLVVILGLLATSEAAYGLPSFTLGLDTPITYLLGPVLGCVLATCVTGVAPGAEETATAQVGAMRALVVAAFASGQLAGTAVVALVLDAARGTDVTRTRLAVLLTATLLFQGVGVLAAMLVQGMAMWFPPLALATALVLFGYSPQGEACSWNLLVADTMPARAVAVGAAGVAGVALVLARRGRPGSANRLVARVRLPRRCGPEVRTAGPVT